MVRINCNELRKILDADGEFELDTGKFRVSYERASNTLKVSGKVKIEIDDATVNVGGIGAQALVDRRIIDWLNAHTHPTHDGATSTPTVPAVAANFTTKTLNAK